MRKTSVIAGAAVLLLAAANPAGAADLISPGSLKDGPVTNSSWAGAYAGINAGYGWDANVSFSDSLPAGTTINGTTFTNLATGVAPQGWFGGGQAGYNFQQASSSFVWGIETDLQAANISATGTFPGTTASGTTTATAGGSKSTIDYFGTLRVRGGVLLGSSVLPYVTGGLAYGGFSERSTSAAWTAAGDSVQAGWTVGTGAETKFSDHWSVKVEYLYTDFPSVAFGTTGSKQDYQVNSFRAGLNYRF